ncbi:MAG: PilZ domain-containing protein [Oligoflexia bacterium]|nr:PilZ domain-containing protein [Oligoflexia bacterium]
MNLERRQSYRFSRRHQDHWHLSLDDDSLITGNIDNVSATGLCIKIPLSYFREPGEGLKLNLKIDTNFGFDCDGRVAWTKKVDGSDLLMGIEFLNLPQSVDQKLAAKIQKWVLEGQKLEVSRQITASKKERTSNIALVSLAVSAGIILAITSWVQWRYPETQISSIFSKSLHAKILKARESR